MFWLKFILSIGFDIESACENWKFFCFFVWFWFCFVFCCCCCFGLFFVVVVFFCSFCFLLLLLFFFNFCCCCCCCCCLFFSFWKKVYFKKYHFANPLVEFLLGGISEEFLKQLVLRLLSSHSSLEYFIKLGFRCLRSKFFIIQRLHTMVTVS